ncbi:MAG: succinylglutamate desuccinylase/aspartoacylase family protein [Candidatus Zipacnadales bacterium]
MPPISEKVPPGSLQRTALTVEDPEVHHQWRVPVLLLRGATEGPVLCLVSAQRGLDISGSAAIHLLCRRLDLHDLKGLILAIPIANPPAVRTKRSSFPSTDGDPGCCPYDLDSVWPGNPEGHLVERLAAEIWAHCIEPAHSVLDFQAHAAQYGPLVTARLTSDASVAAAKAFGVAHVRLTRESEQAALYDVAARQGKAALRVSLVPPGMVEPASVRLALTGMRNMLTHLHMSDRGISPHETALVPPGVETREWYAPADGFVISHVDPGSIVQEGAIIAELISLHTGEVASEVIAPFRGVVGLLGCPRGGNGAEGTDIVTQGELYARMFRCDL